MPHGVDATVDAVEATCAQPRLDRVGSDTDIEQLPASDCALLRDRNRNRGLIRALYAQSRARLIHPPSVGRPPLPICRRLWLFGGEQPPPRRLATVGVLDLDAVGHEGVDGD